MDNAIYRDLMGQTSKSCPIPHRNFPSHNLLSVEELVKNLNNSYSTTEEDQSSDFLSDFPCYKLFEYNVKGTCALYNGLVNTDVAVNFVNRKLNWERNLKEIKITDIKKAIQQIKKLKKGVPDVLPENLTNFIKHFENDPEPAFHGTHNWLYSGGNLCLKKHNNKFVLLSADYSNMNTCGKTGFNVLFLNETLDEIQYKSFNTLKASSPVLQICCKTKDNYLYVFVRQKNFTTFFKFNADEFLIFPENMWKKKTNHPKLVTCMDINDSCTEVVVADTNHKLHIFDVEKKTKSYRCCLRKLKDRVVNRDAWSHVIFKDYSMLVGLRNYFCVFDIRDSSVSPKFTYSPSLELNPCEEICSIVPSACDSNYVYLGTTHCCMQVDLRNGKSLQKWTHMMKNPPQFAATANDNNMDFMVLQSQQVEETVGITNKFTRSENSFHFLSESTPCILKGPKDSLKLARLNGFCLNPFLEKRLNYAVTGIQCQKNILGDIHLFSVNSGGDIFLSKIRKKDEYEDESMNKEEVLQSMKRYESHVEKFFPESTDFNCVETVDMAHLFKKLQNKKEFTYKRPDFELGFHRMLTGETSLHCKDILAQKILKVWGVEEEQFALDDEEMTSEMKVSEWMEKI